MTPTTSTRDASTAPNSPSSSQNAPPQLSQPELERFCREALGGFQTFNEGPLLSLVRCCHAWILAMHRHLDPRWLTITGTSGTGKTHCAKHCLAWASPRYERHLIDADLAYEPRVYWPRLIEQLRLRSESAFDHYHELMQHPVVLIDDIFADRDNTGFATDKLNTLLGARTGKWTLITSNAEPKIIRASDERIFSRLIRPPNSMIHVNAHDFAGR